MTGPRLAAIAAAAGRIKAKSFTIDGEAVVLGPDGLSRFEKLSRREGARTAILRAFDLIQHDGDTVKAEKPYWFCWPWRQEGHDHINAARNARPYRRSCSDPGSSYRQPHVHDQRLVRIRRLHGFECGIDSPEWRLQVLLASKNFTIARARMAWAGPRIFS
jgi:hypothetical protein